MGARVTMACAIGASLYVLGSVMSGPSAAREAAALSGVVRDTQGAALPGVTVTVSGPIPPPITVVTDADGAFAIARLTPGRYTVIATLPGCEPVRQTVQVGGDPSPPTLAITLDAGAGRETIVGTAASTAGQARR